MTKATNSRKWESGLEIGIDAGSEIPIYVQLKNNLRYLITSGTLKPGVQLPTVRALSVDLGINANTVARVYRELAAESVIDMRRGMGSFVPESIPALPRDRVDEFLERVSNLLELALNEGGDKRRIADFLREKADDLLRD